MDKPFNKPNWIPSSQKTVHNLRFAKLAHKVTIAILIILWNSSLVAVPPVDWYDDRGRRTLLHQRRGGAPAPALRVTVLIWTGQRMMLCPVGEMEKKRRANDLFLQVA